MTDLNEQNRKASAIAHAALLTLKDNHLLHTVDWKRAGVTRHDAEHWWKHYRKELASRHQVETELKKQLTLRNRALKKLTKEERAAVYFQA